MGEETKNVFIIDSHLGFVFWLSRALDRAGFVCWPARSVADARALLSKSETEVNLLLIDPSMAGTIALAEDLLKRQRHLRVIGLYASNAEVPRHEPVADSWLQRPRSRTVAASLELVSAILDRLSSNPHSGSNPGPLTAHALESRAGTLLPE
jgi:hypothetical protein